LGDGIVHIEIFEGGEPPDPPCCAARISRNCWTTILSARTVGQDAVEISTECFAVYSGPNPFVVASFGNRRPAEERQERKRGENLHWMTDHYHAE
jgi:hypothetical protein